MNEGTTARSPLPRALAAFAGFVTIGIAVGIGHLVGALTNIEASPFTAVSDDLLNVFTGVAPLRDFGIAVFGEYDGIALQVTVAIAMIVIGVVVGLLSRRAVRPMLIGVLALGLVGGACVLLDISATGVQVDVGPTGIGEVLPSLAAIAAGIGSAVLLFGRRAVADGPEPAATGPSRRAVLAGGTGIGAAAALSGVIGQYAIGQGGDVRASQAALGRIMPVEPAPPIPAGADFAADGSPSFITPNADFYRVDVNRVTIPQLTAEDWRLRIHGMVDNEITLDWNDLTRRRMVERTVTMTCVSNQIGGPYVSTTNFTGVMLADILEEAGVQRGADQLFATSVDGWTCGSPTEAAMDRSREAMLVVAMNREPLPVEHGFPVRVLIPGLYGFVSGTKWVTEMELTTFAAKQAYWLERDWGQRAPIRTMSRIDSPGSFDRVGPDAAITGIAWAQTVGIDLVEVRVDDGEWTPAELSTEVNVNTWRMWRFKQRFEPGAHIAEVRATDKSGYTQTQERIMPIPDGATGWHSVRFTVQ